MELEVLCTRLREATARSRRLLVARKGAKGRSVASIAMPPARRVAFGVKHFLEKDGKLDWLGQRGEVGCVPRVRSTGGPLLPKPVGHAKLDGA